MSTTVTTRRNAQRFTQKMIPSLIEAYKQDNNFEDAYAAFPQFDQEIVKKKLVSLGIAESSRPQLTTSQGEFVSNEVSVLVSNLMESFGDETGLSPVFVRTAIKRLREYLPSKD